MSHSLDLRKRVVEYVKDGGSKESAAKLFKVSRWCVYDWCKRKDLRPQSPPGRTRKMDWEALREDVKLHPDKLLRERAVEFGVHINAIWCRTQAVMSPLSQVKMSLLNLELCHE